MKILCVACGNQLRKTAEHDPYVCRDCATSAGRRRYSWLDYA